MTTAHHATLAIVFLVLGGCVGSFLNVCAYRIPRSMSLLRPRSRCPHCRTSIRARDNVPVLGWLLLAGQCRDCRGPISPRYAIVELSVGLLFAAVYLAAIKLTPGDIWERVGIPGVLAGLLASWTAISVIVVAASIRAEKRRSSGLRSLGLGVVGQDEHLARRQRIGATETIPVQLEDLAGAASVSQPVAGDATQALVAANHMDRPFGFLPGTYRPPSG